MTISGSILTDPWQALKPANIFSGGFYYMTLKHDYDCVQAELNDNPLVGNSLDTRIRHPYLGSVVDSLKFMEWVAKLPYNPLSVVTDTLNICFESAATIEAADEVFQAREIVRLEEDVKLDSEASKGRALENLATMSFVSHVSFVAYSVLAVLGFVTTVGAFPTISFALLGVSTGVYFWAFRYQKDNQLEMEDYYTVQVN